MMVLPNSMDRLIQTIQVLQQLQRLLPISATLEDLSDLLACVEVEYGSEILLEHVIQSLVGQHLAAQLELRSAVRRSSQTGREAAA